MNLNACNCYFTFIVNTIYAKAINLNIHCNCWYTTVLTITKSSGIESYRDSSDSRTQCMNSNCSIKITGYKF